MVEVPNKIVADNSLFILFTFLRKESDISC